MKWRAFTLIELLVVIGIITILIAIVIPVMRVSKQYALTTKCSSNIKQLTLNLVSYDIKNEAFPYSLFFSNIGSLPEKDYADPSKDMIGWRWINYIFDDSAIKLNQKSVLWCPSRRMGDDFYKLKNNMLIANYGVNQSVCKSWLPKSDEFEGSPLSSTNIRSPSQTLLIVDSGYSIINWHHVIESPPIPLGNRIEDRSYLPGLSINKNRNLLPVQEDDANNGRHLGKTVNIGFADGHVVIRKKAEDLLVEKTSDGYQNLSPLWLPEKK